MHSKLKGILYAFLGGSLWGFSGVCGQYLLQIQHIDSSYLVCIRLLMAGLLLLGVSFIKDKNKVFEILKHSHDFIYLCLFSIAGILACQYTYIITIYYTNSATASVLQYLGILVIVLVTCLISKKLPTLKVVLCACLAIAGTFLIATKGHFNALAITPTGLIWGLVSAVALASYTMLPKKLISRYGATVVTGYGMFIAGILFSLFTRPWQYTFHYDLNCVLALLSMILFGTAIAYSLYLTATGYIGAVKTSMIACVEPVVAMIISFLWLHTTFTFYDILGSGAIILMVILLSQNE